MRFFFDTEFVEETMTLISIGIVGEDGREFYAENTEVNDYDGASVWVLEHIIPLLQYNTLTEHRSVKVEDGPNVSMSGTSEEIAGEIFRFCNAAGPIHFYAWFASYDWVLFCRLFGGLMHLPARWPQYVLDLTQLSFQLGHPNLPTQPEEGKHHALNDARWNRDVYNYLVSKGGGDC